MTAPWHIIRCNRYHEARVMAVIADAGWEVWSPQQLIIARHPAARRHTAMTDVIREKWHPLLPGCLFSPILSLPDALRECGRYPCSLEMLNGATPSKIAFDAISRFMVEIDAENMETRRRCTPRGPAVREKRIWRDWSTALTELAAA